MVQLGQRLHQKRLQRKQSLEEIAGEIKIKAKFLSAIEHGEYQSLPSPAYAQGFVKNYAAYLGFSNVQIMALFKREFDAKKAYKVLPDSLTKTKEFPLKKQRVQQSLVILIAVLVFIFCYLIFQYRSAFLSPFLTVTSPKESTINSQQVMVIGRSDPNATVTVNELAVSVTNDGTFRKQLTLFPGRAMVSIKATNKFGKQTIVQKSIIIR